MENLIEERMKIPLFSEMVKEAIKIINKSRNIFITNTNDYYAIVQNGLSKLKSFSWNKASLRYIMDLYYK